MIDPATLVKGEFYKLTIRSKVVDKTLEWQVSGRWGGRFCTAGGHYCYSVTILPHRQFIDIGLTTSQEDQIIRATIIKPTYKEK